MEISILRHITQQLCKFLWIGIGEQRQWKSQLTIAYNGDGIITLLYKILLGQCKRILGQQTDRNKCRGPC